MKTKKTIGNGKSRAVHKSLKCNSSAAELELLHLENVMRGLARSSVTELPVGSKYWRGRVESVDRDFELLPVQLARLANITRLIDEIERAIDQTNSETRRSDVFEKSPD